MPAVPEHTDRAICSDPGTPYLGQRFVAGTMEGATVSYSCGSGFVLEGDAQRTCLDSGQWSGEVPQCRSKSSNYSLQV